MEGVLPARSKHIVTGVVRPHRRVLYQFTITYQLLTPEGLLYEYNFKISAKLDIVVLNMVKML